MTRIFRTLLIAAALLSLAIPSFARDYYFGADLSYVNEMKACGATYSYQGKTQDPYDIFAASGTNLVRVRLWNNATWTRYSNLADVETTLRAAKAHGQKTLLDFHYSDDWADGDKQIAPAAWAGLSEDDQVTALYRYTLDTLNALKAEGLMPDMVQIGNETNHEMVSSKEGAAKPINWERNARLFNAGFKAVRDASVDSAIKPKIMIHIAQPENVEAWFQAATAAGVTGYDIIGMSYYRKWSKEDFAGLGQTIQRVHALFNKDVIVVETAYAFTDDAADNATNLLGSDSRLPGYAITPDGQARYMRDIMQLTLDNGGIGVVYWEPAWVSTSCKTRWAQGSNWENATFFDFHGKALPALEWPKAAYVFPVEMTFKVADHGQASQYLSGDFSDGVPLPMQKAGAFFTYKAWLRPGSHILVATATSSAQLDAAEAHQMTVPADAGEAVVKETQLPSQ